MVSEVIHFMPDEDDRVACGARVFLCSDYTDEPRHVDCGRCKRTKRFRDFDPVRYDVDVWNHEGDVIDFARRVTAERADEMREQYADDPLASVVVEEA